MKDYYKTLEISPTASLGQIKEQYRFLLHAWHPDKFPNPNQKAKAEEKVKEINEAYSILSDPNKRTQYDGARSYDSAKTSGRNSESQEASRRAEYERQQRAKEEAERARRSEEEQRKKSEAEDARQRTREEQKKR